jgi:two-component system chemotaxis response regulator CheB
MNPPVGPPSTRIEAGGKILTEAESSCVVYGMPHAVFEAGVGAEAVDLEGMSAAILRAL